MSRAYRCDRCEQVREGKPAGPDVDLEGDACGLTVGDITFELNDHAADYDLCPECFAFLLELAARQAGQDAIRMANAAKEKP